MFVSGIATPRACTSISTIITSATCSTYAPAAGAPVRVSPFYSARPHGSKRFFGTLRTFSAVRAGKSAPEFSFPAHASLYEYSVKDIDSQQFDLASLKGKVVLVVNVACECGLTSSNYSQLADIYKKYSKQGLEVIAFPCNQFGQQEPGGPADIKSFVKKYDVEFPLMEKVEVNGAKAIPLYKDFLKAKFPGDISWNFGKFLVNKNGEVVKRYEPTVAPTQIEADIKALL